MPGFQKTGCLFDILELLKFCTKCECNDALVWFLMHTDRMHIEDQAPPDLDARQIRYLMACLVRLHEPIALYFDSGTSWSGACRGAFVNALPKNKGIKGFLDSCRVFSKQETERSNMRVSLEDGMVADGNGMLIQAPEQTFATSLENLARYRDQLATKDLNRNTFPFHSLKYLSLATIAFSLRRNSRLQNRVPTSDDPLPDKAFENAIHILPDARSTCAIDPVPG